MAKVHDWDALARDLAAVPGRSRKRVAELLHKRMPQLHAGIARVKDSPWPLECWGQSNNFDVIARQRIVDPKVLGAIGQVAGFELAGSSCHSGLLHTYGYMFSVIDTPYGKKRDRWVRPTLDKGFGLPQRSLRVMPTDGTLLHNVTWWLARIAWRDDPVWQRRLLRSKQHVSAAVVGYDYAALEITRILQSVRLADRRLVELYTEFVPFPCRRTKAEHALLLYWCRTRRCGKRLLTAFPVSAASMAEGVALGRVARGVARPGFNAFIEGFDEPRPARCQLATGTG